MRGGGGFGLSGWALQITPCPLAPVVEHIPGGEGVASRMLGSGAHWKTAFTDPLQPVCIRQKSLLRPPVTVSTATLAICLEPLSPSSISLASNLLFETQYHWVVGWVGGGVPTPPTHPPPPQANQMCEATRARNISYADMLRCTLPADAGGPTHNSHYKNTPPITL